MLHAAKPTRLPPRTALLVEFAGRNYPAWVDRWSRTVFAACGPISKAAGIVVEIEGTKVSKRHHDLAAKLHRWGYRTVSLKTNQV